MGALRREEIICVFLLNSLGHALREHIWSVGQDGLGEPTREPYISMLSIEICCWQEYTCYRLKYFFPSLDEFLLLTVI